MRLSAALYKSTWLAWVMFALFSAQTQASAAPCEAFIDGHIVDEMTHEPIAGATVFLNGEAVELADGSGRFHLTGLCPGTYVVAVERSDYLRDERSVDLTRAAAMEIELKSSWEETIVVETQTPRVERMQSEATVSGEALARTRGKSFSDAVEAVPGVTQLRSPSGLGKPIVRGQFGRRLSLIVDGARHRAQDWGADHAPEIDPFIADEIAVIRGAAGVRYGPDAIGGAIIARPSELLRDPGTRSELHVFGIHRRGGGLAGRVDGRSSRAQRLAWRLEGSIKRLAAPLTPDYALHNTGSYEWAGGATVGYELNTANLQLSYRRYQAELGVCACLRIESIDDFRAQLERERPIDADLYRPDFDIGRPKQTVTHDTASLASDSRIRSAGTLELRYTLQMDRRREFDVVRAATGPQFDFELLTHDFSLALQHQPLHITDHLHSRGTIGVLAMAQNHDFAGFSLIPDYRAWSAGVYVIERLVGHDYEIEGGLRYDRLRRNAYIVRDDFMRLVRSGQLGVDACAADDGASDPVACRSTFDTLSASLGALYQLTEPWSIKLALATAARPPNPDEQYLNGTSPTSPVLGLGKPDLAPETTYSAALTTKWQSDAVAAEASVYANYIGDYIYFAPALDAEGEPIFDVLSRGSFPRFVTRPVDALFYGADGGVTWQLWKAIELSGQLALVRARNTDDDSYLAFVPADRFRMAARYVRGGLLGLDKLSIAGTGTVVRRQDRFEIAADLAPPPAGYFLFGAEIDATGELFGRRAVFSMQGSNLLNTRYREYTSLLRYFADQPGWQLLVRLSLSFEEREERR